MFDVGFWEMALIAIIALIVVGPERLPGLARTVGVWVGKARRMLANVKAEVDREIKNSPIDEVKNLNADLKSAGQAVSDSVSDINQAGDDLVIDMKKSSQSTPKHKAQTAAKK